MYPMSALPPNDMNDIRQPDFFLASTEGYNMERPRKCMRVKRLYGEHRDDYLLIRISPPLPGQHDGEAGIDLVIVATRHKGATLFPITTWPVYVHVAVPIGIDPLTATRVAKDQLVNIAWAELYRTAYDAFKNAL